MPFRSGREIVVRYLMVNTAAVDGMKKDLLPIHRTVGDHLQISVNTDKDRRRAIIKIACLPENQDTLDHFLRTKPWRSGVREERRWNNRQDFVDLVRSEEWRGRQDGIDNGTDRQPSPIERRGQG